jgi:hypothetical protein
VTAARWPVSAFVALVIATVAAFFVIQHLKVTTPLINGFPAPAPSVINPVSGGTCLVRIGNGVPKPVSFRRMTVSFYLQNRADDVDVWIVGPDQTTIVRQIGSDVHMQTRPHPMRHSFEWDGRLADGSVAPDGRYYVRVRLIHEARSVLISNASGPRFVTVQTTIPPVTVTGVSPAVIPPQSHTTIRYTGTDGQRPQIRIYRLGPNGMRLVKQFAASTRQGRSVWDGTVAGPRPAPGGRYLIVVGYTNQTCNRVHSALSPAAAPRAVVTVG